MRTKRERLALTARLEKGAQNIVAQLTANTHDIYDAPVIHVDADGVSIHWDGAPNWTMNDGYGEFEEYASEIESITGQAPQYEEKNYWVDPKGIFAEPISYYSLGIFEA